MSDPTNAPAADPAGRVPMSEERLEEALWQARAMETHGGLFSDSAAPLLRELHEEVRRLRAKNDALALESVTLAAREHLRASRPEPTPAVAGPDLDRFRELLDEYRHAIHATEWATTEERVEYERAEWAKRWELFSAIAALRGPASAATETTDAE